MADIAIFRINYKSDFVLTVNSDAGWAVPFCIKFWTGMPSQAYFAGFDGEDYVNCRVGETPTQLLVMFDDHHMPIGELKMQIAYHTTIEEFPDRKFDEVTNPTNVTVDIDGTEYQVMLDFTGETGAEIDFSMPSSGVMSVNGKIGYVTLNAEDVGAQPTIEDLATIRSGAADGATAVQPDEMTAALATKQDVISDLSTIRSGAAEGATAYQKPGTGIPESDLASGVQSSLHKADAAAPQSNTYTKGEVDTLIEGAISDIDVDDALSNTSENPVQNKVVTTALNGKQATISDLSTIRSGAAAGATAVQPAALTPIESALQTIEAVIPSAASSQNQLADKNFVNSSISTNTANFVGTYNSLAELQAVQNPTNNDYGFVIETDAQGNEYYDRYKYVASSQQWLFEYKVESTPFTAAQWAAIQSGITSALVTKLNALPTNAELQQTLDGKADAADIPTALSQLSQDSTHRVVTDAEKSTWNGKQNAISDLATIRSGAAAGATAVQPAAMNTALAAKQDTLTFDNTPTANSDNPVKSGGIKTALDAKQTTISTVNVTVDNNTGTPSGIASVSGSTLSLSFQNLKGATGATGATGPQGPQGERGLPGESGVTGDVSGFTVIQTIDPSATYGATDIAGAATVQSTNAELTELSGYLSIDSSIQLVYVGKYVLDKTTGELVSNNYYKLYEGSLSGIKSLATTNNKGSSSVGTFALFDDSDNLIGTVATDSGTNKKRTVLQGSTKFKIATYTTEASAKGAILVSVGELKSEIESLSNYCSYKKDIKLDYVGNYVLDLTTGDLISNNNYMLFTGSIENCYKLYTTNAKGSSSPGLFAFYNEADELIGSVYGNTGTNIARSIPNGATKFKMASTGIRAANGDFYLISASEVLRPIHRLSREDAINNSVGYTIKPTSLSTNLINVNDLLHGYSISTGSFTTKLDGIFSNKIYADKGVKLTCKGVRPFSTQPYLYVAYFDKNDNFLSRGQYSYLDSTEQICTFTTPSSTEWAYLRILIYGNQLGNAGLETPICSIGASVGEYEEYIAGIEFLSTPREQNMHVPHILLVGASFAYNANAWFDTALGMLKASGTNKAASGTSIMDTAKSMYNGTLYTIDDLDKYDILMIMHVHNQNVADSEYIKNDYTEYTYEEISNNYTQAYDYVIRKWQADCYNQKDNQDSKWYGSKYGKPAMIVLCTSWHNGRTIYNDSIRILAEKFALPLVDWASQIGVSSSVNNPVTGSNATVYYAQDMEGSRGWHPLRDANPNGTIQWLQVRMAAIAANVLKPVCDSFLYID